MVTFDNFEGSDGSEVEIKIHSVSDGSERSCIGLEERHGQKRIILHNKGKHSKKDYNRSFRIVKVEITKPKQISEKRKDYASPKFTSPK